ncbi:UNKNOWN [Stylonychia lemnae]|uniref:Cadg domain containing protein n=1 Tax=Stylonychia lemnae TaxID=5949 RepID=A0A078AGF1_STYLE|nr:UNKNOWN [Stylonychia lemnae]|eukprot:CDW80617.1 UNKNOWN [Stylonychia lemnae]
MLHFKLIPMIGGSTSDNQISLLSGEKPLIVYVKKGGEFQWTMILNILSYISVSAISFKDISTTQIALSLQTTPSSTDPFNILKFSSALANKNTVFYLKWPQNGTLANAITIYQKPLGNVLQLVQKMAKRYQFYNQMQMPFVLLLVLAHQRGWMDLLQVLYVGTIQTLTSEDQKTTTFVKNIGWFMNIDPSSSEIIITNTLTSPESISNETLTYSYSSLSNQFSSAITQIVPQIITTSNKTILTTPVTNKVYTIGTTAMYFTVPAFTLQQTCLDVVFKYTSDISTVQNFVTFTSVTRMYTIFTNNQAFSGIYTIKMKGRINNEQSAEVEIQLFLIGACLYASIAGTSQPDKTFTLNGGIQNFTLNSFSTNTTGCSITYTLSDASLDSLIQTSGPGLFTFNQTSMVLSCNPTLSTQIGTYNLSLVGNLYLPQYNGEINPKNQTIYFKVIVQDEPCNTAQVQVVTPQIYDMTYIYGYPEKQQQYSFTVIGGKNCLITYKLVDDLGIQNAFPIVFDNTSIKIQSNNGTQDLVKKYKIIASVNATALAFETNVFNISQISLQTACLTVPISQQSLMNNFTYSLNQGKSNLTNITYYQGDGQNYSFNAFANNQTFNLSIANGGSPVTFEIQIRIKQGSSQKNCTPVFSVTIDDIFCLNADLTSNTFNELVSQYKIGDSAIILTFNKWNDEFFKCGEYEYSISFNNTFISGNFVTANLTERSVRIYGINLSILTQVFTITLKGSIYNGRYLQVDKTIKIINPCQDLKLSLISNSETTYYLNDSIKEFQLQQSTLNQLPDLICPQNIEHSVRSLSYPSQPTFIKLIQNIDYTLKIQVQSNITSSIGSYDFNYTAMYMNQTVSYIFTLQIKEKITCTGIQAPQIEDYSYKIGSGLKIFSHKAFYTIPLPNFCSELTVKAFVEESQTFPQFIQYNRKFQQISINSQDIKDEGEYLITIGGYTQAYNSNASFILIMLNPCKNAQIKPSSIKDVLYIIGSGEMLVKFVSWKSTISECNDFTYEALNEEQSLPIADVVDFDSNSKTFKIKVDNSKLDGKNYVIKVIGRSFYGFQKAEFILLLSSNLVYQTSQVDIYGGKMINLSKLKQDLKASIKQISIDGQVQVTAIKALAAMADVASSSITGSTTINLILSIVLGVSMKNLWMLLNTLQILVMIPLLWLSLPANITIMCKALIDIANLNFIPKDTINEYVRKFLFETQGTTNYDDVLNTIVAATIFLSLLLIPFIILNFLRKHLCNYKTEFIQILDELPRQEFKDNLVLLIFQYCYFPFDTKNQQFFEIYNETTILLVSYCLLPYSQDYFTENTLNQHFFKPTKSGCISLSSHLPFDQKDASQEKAKKAQ